MFEPGLEVNLIRMCFKVFMAGGHHVTVPCSHVAHVEREGQRMYRQTWTNHTTRNYVRLIESLFDEKQKATAYYFNPSWKVK